MNVRVLSGNVFSMNLKSLFGYIEFLYQSSFINCNSFQFKTEMEELLQAAQDDTDQWVAMVGDILKTYPATGNLNSDVESSHAFFHEVVNDLRKLGITITASLQTFGYRLRVTAFLENVCATFLWLCRLQCIWSCSF